MNIQMEMLFFYHTVIIILHIEGGEPVQNHLISIFYSWTSSPDHICGVF